MHLKNAISFYELYFELPQECIDDCATSGSNDDAVRYWVKELDLTVDRGRAIKYLEDRGFDGIAARSDIELADAILWEACWNARDMEDQQGRENE